MNYIRSFIFLMLMILIYYLIGHLEIRTFKINKNRFALKIVMGWLSVFSLGWIVGFPCQIKATSWNKFVIIYSICLIILVIISIILSRKNIYLFFKEYKNWGKYLVKHIKNYWFIYLLVIIFSIVSFTNLMPYMNNNYTDDHYISKVVHLYKSTSLLNFDQAVGNLYKIDSSHNFLNVTGYRILNTYELMYSYFGGIFNIGLVFFCRFVMTLHNYLIVFLAFQLVGSLFLSEGKSQYALCLIALFVIPQGFAARGSLPFKIRMFENWRFQTGIYMGGSITRLISLPLLIYYCNIITCKMNTNNFTAILEKIFLFIILCVGLVSYQTTAISYILLMIPFILIFICTCYGSKATSKNKKIIAYIIGCVFVIAYVFGSNYLIKFLANGSYWKIVTGMANGLPVTKLVKSVNNYHKYYLDSLTYDVFMKYAIIF